MSDVGDVGDASAAAAVPVEVRFEPLTLHNLDAVLAVEQRAYAHPWSRGNFTDSLASGYELQVLLAGDTVLGYFVGMKGVDEVHLLNITVAPITFIILSLKLRSLNRIPTSSDSLIPVP